MTSSFKTDLAPSRTAGWMSAVVLFSSISCRGASLPTENWPLQTAEPAENWPLQTAEPTENWSLQTAEPAENWPLQTAEPTENWPLQTA